MHPLVRRTWAPRRETPILYRKGASHPKITVVGALTVSHKGKKPGMYFRHHQGKNANASACVAFLEQLYLNTKGPLIVIWDRLRAHRSKKVLAWVDKHPRI